jgi:acylphosphatase
MASSKDEKRTSGRRGGRRGPAKRVKLTIRGDVQDVGFRLRLLSEAQRLSLSEFFADNLPDKETVVVYVGGMAAAVDEFVNSVRKMKTVNPGVVSVVIERHKGDIWAIRDYVDYLHTEQLSKGVEAVQTLGETLKEAARGFAESVVSGFSHMDEQFDRIPRRVADEMRRG